MARRRRPGSVLETAGAAVGRTLGKLAAQWAALDRQRTQVGAEISRLVSSMTGGGPAGAILPARLGRHRGGRPKGFKMSEATKRKLRAAWKRRKAAAKAKLS